jgi:DNA-binding FadR family transcriptional regulator
MMINTLSFSSLDLAILQVLAKSSVPAGSGTLSLALRQAGFTISAPTIGRRLREMEMRRLLKKSGVDGRVLTTTGRRKLRQLEEEASLEGHGRALIYLVRSRETQHILDLLGARRLIEREAAALAATRASRTDIRRLAEIIARQQAEIKAGRLGIEADITFHEQLAQISGNAVLRSIVSLLRRNSHYNYLITMMRQKVGSRLIVDHTRVLDAIRKRDGRLAWEAMDDHLAALDADVKRYTKDRQRTGFSRSVVGDQ